MVISNSHGRNMHDLALSVVIPTFNERDNIMPLLLSLRDTLEGIATEIIFVDDSNDDTPDIIAAAQRQLATQHFVISLLHRSAGPARKDGLAGAVRLGLAQASATYTAILDADLQHPPERLKVLFERAIKHDADVVVATRYRPGGSYDGLENGSRRLFSIGMKWLAKMLFPDQLLRLSDPLGGFFLIRSTLLEGVVLRPLGYKISLELLIRCQWSKLVEIPYQFQARNAGTSKATLQQGLLVLRHMTRLIREVPAAARFWKFCLVGASGAAINLLLFSLALHQHAPIVLGWLIATEASLLSNFVLHHVITWREIARHRWVERLLSYHGTVALGTLCTLVIFLCCNAFTHNPLFGQAIALILGMLINYWLAKHIAFAQQPVEIRLPRERNHNWQKLRPLDSQATILP